MTGKTGWRSRVAVALIVVAAGGIVVFIGVRSGLLPSVGTGPAGPERRRPARVVDPAIADDATAIFRDDDALFSYVKKFGGRRTVQRLHELSATLGSCHDPAHRTGRFAYELVGDKAFQTCSAECHSGCYHGATEAFFRDRGTANLADNLRVICSSELNPFLSHQCIHGVGHGLMAWANYELIDALRACDLLPERRDSCWTGVFMENIVGSLAAREGHFTKYLSDDPHHPCTTVEDTYRSSCYFLQTSRMLQLFGADFRKVAAACLEAPARYQRHCFESMGRDVGGIHRRDSRAAIAACANAPRGSARTGCLLGAVGDLFWDSHGQDDAIRFCRLLADPAEKDACYTSILVRAPDILGEPAAVKAFCAKAEPAYRKRCPQSLGS
jgi:hypothetical protein